MNMKKIYFHGTIHRIPFIHFANSRGLTQIDNPSEYFSKPKTTCVFTCVALAYACLLKVSFRQGYSQVKRHRIVIALNIWGEIAKN